MGKTRRLLQRGETSEWLPCRSLVEEIRSCPPKDDVQFVFHGTPKKATAAKILREGFHPHSYFASEFDNAFASGNYILRVATCLPREHRWQWTESLGPCPDRIHQLIQVNPKVLYEDAAVGKAVFEVAQRKYPSEPPAPIVIH